MKHILLALFLFCATLSFGQYSAAIGTQLQNEINSGARNSIFTPYASVSYSFGRFVPSTIILFDPKRLKYSWGIKIEYTIVKLKRD